MWVLQISGVSSEGLGPFLHGSPSNIHWITLAWVLGRLMSLGKSWFTTSQALEHLNQHRVLTLKEETYYESDISSWKSSLSPSSIEGECSEALKRGNVIKITFPSWGQLNYQPLTPKQIYLFKTGGLNDSLEKYKQWLRWHLDMAGIFHVQGTSEWSRVNAFSFK